MPAIITHDTFGRDAYARLYEIIGESNDECNAFLLGNQGPDVLFYGSVNPLARASRGLGTQMHRERTSELLRAFVEAANLSPAIDPASQLGTTHTRLVRENVGATPFDIAWSYVLGFVCHYALDSTVHPFVYAQQTALCTAGEPGLDESCGHEVHATIESELDELVLSVKRKETIASFDPSERILRANDYVLDIVSTLHAEVAWSVFGRRIEPNAFKTSVKAFRQVQRLVYSASGLKREAIGRVETMFRRFSFLRALSHRNVSIEESIFDNHERLPWTDPASDSVRTETFWDLYDNALRASEEDIAMLLALKGHPERVRREAFAQMTQGLNFNGDVLGARIVATEDII